MMSVNPRRALKSFDTARLSVTHWADCLADPMAQARLVDDLAGLLSPAVLAPLPASYAFDPEAAADWIAARQDESDVYLVRRGAEGVLVGLMILAEIAPRELYLGYLLGEPHWRQGYGGELVKGVVAEFGRLAPLTVVAQVEPANIASVRVLLGAGFEGVASADEMRRFRLKL
ncbi:MAG TPA: hypothetical protein DEO85_16975 [Maritimibacter sp.]|nr:hypothetical protein [Maritimibacter sp.]